MGSVTTETRSDNKSFPIPAILTRPIGMQRDHVLAVQAAFGSARRHAGP
jgi:hypothetical protein